jgi:hypothetical protein
MRTIYRYPGNGHPSVVLQVDNIRLIIDGGQIQAHSVRAEVEPSHDVNPPGVQYFEGVEFDWDRWSFNRCKGNPLKPDKRPKEIYGWVVDMLNRAKPKLATTQQLKEFKKRIPEALRRMDKAKRKPPVSGIKS